MALTVSSISAEFVKDTKTIGKQAAYLDFDFGGRIHNTETLKKAGKSATWEHPVQLTGAGVNMKIIAKASKTLGKDNILGEAEINVVKAAGQGMQQVTLVDPATRELGGKVSFIISGGSPAISGLPHTDGMGSQVAGMIPGHSHESTGATGTGVGAGGLGGGQQSGLGQQGHGREALAGAGAGAGAAGLGAAALHHHNKDQQGLTGTGTQGLPGTGTGVSAHGYSGTGTQGLTGTGGQQGYSGTGGQGLGQQGGHEGYEKGLMGAGAGAGAAGLGAAALHHHNQGQQQQGLGSSTGQGITGSREGGFPSDGVPQQGWGMQGTPGSHTIGTQGGLKERIERDLQGGSHVQGGSPVQGGTGGMGASSGAPIGGGGIGGMGTNQQGQQCDHCHGTGTIEQRLQQGLGLGGHTSSPSTGTTGHLRT